MIGIHFTDWSLSEVPIILCHIPLPPRSLTPNMKHNKTTKQETPSCFESNRSPLITHTCTKMNINLSALQEYGANQAEVYLDCCYVPVRHGNR